MAELTPQEKRKQTLAKKQKVNAIVSKYGEFADLLPADLGWFDSKESAVELLKSMHVDIMGVDKQGNARPFNDLKYFLFQAAQRQMNPFKGQIHAVYIWDSQKKAEQLVVITGIGGLRKNAQMSRHPLYAGSEPYEWEWADGSVSNENDADAHENEHPIKAIAKVCAYNPVTGEREVIATGIAWWDEYVKLVDEYGEDRKKTGKKIPNTTWRTKGKLMLAKCAEAQALRQGWPEQTGGLYTSAEIDHLRNEPSEDELKDVEQSKRDAIKEELERRRKEGTVFDGEVVEDKPETEK